MGGADGAGETEASGPSPPGGAKTEARGQVRRGGRPARPAVQGPGG